VLPPPFDSSALGLQYFDDGAAFETRHFASAREDTGPGSAVVGGGTGCLVSAGGHGSAEAEAVGPVESRSITSLL